MVGPHAGLHRKAHTPHAHIPLCGVSQDPVPGIGVPSSATVWDPQEDTGYPGGGFLHGVRTACARRLKSHLWRLGAGTCLIRRIYASASRFWTERLPNTVTLCHPRRHPVPGLVACAQCRNPPRGLAWNIRCMSGARGIRSGRWDQVRGTGNPVFGGPQGPWENATTGVGGERCSILSGRLHVSDLSWG